MTDLADLNDAELEARVRETLRAVAAATPTDDGTLPAYDAEPPRRTRWLAAAAALVLVAGGAAVAMRALDDGAVTVRPPVTLPPAPPGGDQGPSLSDGPVFSAEGDAPLVASSYLNARMADVSTNVQWGQGKATARWSLEDDSGQVAAGTVHLAYLADRWAVVEAVTDDVEVTGLRVEDGRLRATVSTTNVNSLVVEVLDTEGNPIGDADRIGPTSDPVELDVAVGDQPVVLRAQLIGGAMLSVTELLVDPAAPESGTNIADGAWEGGTWRMLTGDGPCAWIELNGVAQTPTCGTDSEPGVARVFAPVSRYDGETLYYGVLRGDVATVRIHIADGQTIAASTIPSPSDGRDYRFVAVSVPSVEPATAELVAADGSVVGDLALDPAEVGRTESG